MCFFIHEILIESYLDHSCNIHNCNSTYNNNFSETNFIKSIYFKNFYDLSMIKKIHNKNNMSNLYYFFINKRLFKLYFPEKAIFQNIFSDMKKQILSSKIILIVENNKKFRGSDIFYKIDFIKIFFFLNEENQKVLFYLLKKNSEKCLYFKKKYLKLDFYFFLFFLLKINRDLVKKKNIYRIFLNLIFESILIFSFFNHDSKLSLGDSSSIYKKKNFFCRNLLFENLISSNNFVSKISLKKSLNQGILEKVYYSFSKDKYGLVYIMKILKKFILKKGKDKNYQNLTSIFIKQFKHLKIKIVANIFLFFILGKSMFLKNPEMFLSANGYVFFFVTIFNFQTNLEFWGNRKMRNIFTKIRVVFFLMETSFFIRFIHLLLKKKKIFRRFNLLIFFSLCYLEKNCPLLKISKKFFLKRNNRQLVPKLYLNCKKCYLNLSMILINTFFFVQKKKLFWNNELRFLSRFIYSKSWLLNAIRNHLFDLFRATNVKKIKSEGFYVVKKKLKIIGALNFKKKKRLVFLTFIRNFFNEVVILKKILFLFKKKFFFIMVFSFKSTNSSKTLLMDLLILIGKFNVIEVLHKKQSYFLKNFKRSFSYFYKSINILNFQKGELGIILGPNRKTYDQLLFFSISRKYLNLKNQIKEREKIFRKLFFLFQRYFPRKGQIIFLKCLNYSFYGGGIGLLKLVDLKFLLDIILNSSLEIRGFYLFQMYKLFFKTKIKDLKKIIEPFLKFFLKSEFYRKHKYATKIYYIFDKIEENLFKKNVFYKNIIDLSKNKQNHSESLFSRQSDKIFFTTEKIKFLLDLFIYLNKNHSNLGDLKDFTRKLFSTKSPMFVYSLINIKISNFDVFKTDKKILYSVLKSSRKFIVQFFPFLESFSQKIKNKKKFVIGKKVSRLFLLNYFKDIFFRKYKFIKKKKFIVTSVNYTVFDVSEISLINSKKDYKRTFEILAKIDKYNP